MGTSVLISGAGIGGSALAYLLGRAGFRVTVVERAAGTRSSGNPVDVRGPAVAVVEEMGLLPALRAAATGADRLVFVDAAGRARTSIRTGGRDGALEVPRARLAGILLGAAREHAEVRRQDSITALTQDDSGVTVTFERGAPATYDYVVGADGLHSTVRGLVFGPERDLVRHMGMYVATVPAGRSYGAGGDVLMYNSPGRAVSVHPGGGSPLAAFMFRSPVISGLGHHDLDRHRDLIRSAFGGNAGIFGEVLDRVRTADDLYFDSVSRVRLPHWSIGRVALLGDAASSVSLFGDGSSLAIAAARTLADELTGAPGDPGGALGRYERRHRLLTGPVHRRARLGAAFLVPGTRAGITVRDTALRAFSPR
ncbi:FAD-dependent monooxygenase [Nocardia sp. NPDC005978]|uniref:FAD-dependent monooxygenase n=1 Tax=Nocardia sp. NPDC005978 TaxID=3156725 RepID=UPI0033A9A0D7